MGAYDEKQSQGHPKDCEGLASSEGCQAVELDRAEYCQETDQEDEQRKTESRGVRVNEDQ